MTLINKIFFTNRALYRLKLAWKMLVAPTLMGSYQTKKHHGEFIGYMVGNSSRQEIVELIRVAEEVSNSVKQQILDGAALRGPETLAKVKRLMREANAGTNRKKEVLTNQYQEVRKK